MQLEDAFGDCQPEAGTLASAAAFVDTIEAVEDAALRSEFPGLAVHPIAGDFSRMTSLPRQLCPHSPRAAAAALPRGRRVGFFPGSTIGNFTPAAAGALLARIGQALGDDALLVVGVDSTCNRSVLIPAYDDRLGVTAEFNKNLLVRINRELDGDFDPAAFSHEARFDIEQQRIEMHLVSRSWQTVEVLGRKFGFAAGESIHTENSYKYSLPRFEALARRAGWQHVQFWSDARMRFAVQVMERSRAPA